MPRTLLSLLLWASIAAGGDEDESCLKCHADKGELAKARTDPKTPLERYLVDRARYQESVHSRGCAECHFEYETHPHGKDAETVECSECHENTTSTFAAGVHGASSKGSEDLPVSCTTCHGVHDTLKASERNSRLHPLNVWKTCGECHFAIKPSTADVKQILRESFSDDSHARGILLSGLVVSATCVSCHGGHDIEAVSDPKSSVARQNVAATCGACHVGIEDQHRASVHHLRPNGSEHKGATCSDCHHPHEIGPAGADFRRTTILACAECHEERFGTFTQTYHGKVNVLGFGEKAATCTACHGSHQILPQSDPASKVHPSNLVATCAQCHAGAHEEFARYAVHANPQDKEDYPGLYLLNMAMVGLLTVTFAFGGLHAVVWLARAALAGDLKRAPAAHRAERHIRRWRPFYTSLHVTMMITFLLLAATGFPLHFSEKPWAAKLMRFLGGPTAAGWVHRIAALVMIGTILTFLGHVVARLIRREKGMWAGPNTMMPRWRDLRDLWANVRWFLWMGPRPRFDRWTYWEKFDFWAVFWGIAIIGASGLILWFPIQATRFLPAWVINAAVLVHGHEALLAVGFIFSIHVLHTYLRPKKLPMDIMFYTGRITETEFKEERQDEYERAKAAGTLEAMAVDPPDTRTRWRAHVVGTIAIAVGTLLLAVMIAALIESFS